MMLVLRLIFLHTFISSVMSHSPMGGSMVSKHDLVLIRCKKSLQHLIDKYQKPFPHILKKIPSVIFYCSFPTGHECQSEPFAVLPRPDEVSNQSITLHVSAGLSD